MGKIKETDLQERWILQSYFTPAIAPGHQHGKAAAPTDTIAPTSMGARQRQTGAADPSGGRHDMRLTNTKHFGLVS